MAAEGEDENTFEAQLKRYREDPPESDEEASEEESEEVEPEEEEEEEEEESESSETSSSGDEEDSKKKVKPPVEEEKKGEGEEEEEEYGEEYYDEEYDEEEADDEVNITLEGIDITPKLRTKYSFLFKDREEMKSHERRWKWVRPDCLPQDLLDLMDKLKGTKKQKAGKEERAETKKVRDEKDPEADEKENLTQITSRNDLEVDYTVAFNVKERLELLKMERIKGKYSHKLQTQVLSLMADQFVPATATEVRQKVDVQLYLIGTLL